VVSTWNNHNGAALRTSSARAVAENNESCHDSGIKAEVSALDNHENSFNVHLHVFDWYSLI
jgi:hypothetical protein